MVETLFLQGSEWRCIWTVVIFQCITVCGRRRGILSCGNPFILFLWISLLLMFHTLEILFTFINPAAEYITQSVCTNGSSLQWIKKIAFAWKMHVNMLWVKVDRDICQGRSRCLFHGGPTLLRPQPLTTLLTTIPCGQKSLWINEGSQRQNTGKAFLLCFRQSQVRAGTIEY